MAELIHQADCGSIDALAGRQLANLLCVVDARSRAVIVVGPDGTIAGVIPQFNQNDPMAYEELAGIVDEVTPDVEEGN